VGYRALVPAPPRTRGLRRLAPAVAAVAVAAGCELPSFGAPDPASEEGESIFQLWQGFFVASIAVALLVYGLIAYSIIRYRRRDDAVPSQKSFNIPLEIFYTATPVVIVAALFGFSWVTEENVTELASEPANRVDVIGFQWSWQFVYPDEGITITGEPGEPPEMVLPVGEVSRLELTTTDVNHSFWTPEFLSKRDLIPGVDNEIDVTPTETGSYVGRCAEFCGLDHWAMYYSVRVVEPEEYEAWLDEQRASPDQPAEQPADEDERGTAS
jgi:cytochrome c oxidase subunit II